MSKQGKYALVLLCKTRARTYCTHHLICLVLCEGAVQVILDILLQELRVTQLSQLAEHIQQLLGSLKTQDVLDKSLSPSVSSLPPSSLHSLPPPSLPPSSLPSFPTLPPSSPPSLLSHLLPLPPSLLSLPSFSPSLPPLPPLPPSPHTPD